MTRCANCVTPAPEALAIVTAVISSLLFFMTTSGNLLVCMAVYKDPFHTLRTPFTYFLLNLVISNLVSGLVTMPASVVVHVIELESAPNDNVGTLMHVSRNTYFVSTCAVLLSLVMLSLDRYHAIAKPFEHRRHIEPKRRALATGLIWGISLSLPAIYFLTSYMTCLMIFANTCVAVSLGILAFTYFKVYRSLKIQSRKIEPSDIDGKLQTVADSCIARRQKDMMVTRAFLIMLCVLAACYIPVIIIIYVLLFDSYCNCTVRHILRDLQFILGLIFSTSVPFVCALYHHPFRRAVRKILPFKGDCV